NRVVPEAARTRWSMGNNTFNILLNGPGGLSAASKSERTIEHCIPLAIRNRLHFLEDAFDPGWRICSIPGRMHSGPAAQGLDTEAGIVGKREVVYELAIVIGF